MTCGYRLAGSPALGSRKQPTFLDRRLPVVTRRPHLPPLPQQIEHLGREHDVAILAALRLLHANDLLRAVDMLDLEPHHLASAQSAAIAETEHHANLEIVSKRQQPLRFIRTYYQRNPLRRAQVIHLGSEVQAPQCHPEQEAQSGHDHIARADAHASLGQVQLEPADVLERRRLGRSLQKRREPLATADVASLRARTELARIHIFDHTLTQRGDSLGCHGQLLSWMKFGHLILKTACFPHYPRSLPWG